MKLFDANVLLDVATKDPNWRKWSGNQLRIASNEGPILLNPIIYAELAPAFPTVEELDEWLNPEHFLRLPLPYEAAWIASQTFVKYRRSGGTKTTPLPDFYIGAHAQVQGYTLVTRDRQRYRTYFPEVQIITP